MGLGDCHAALGGQDLGDVWDLQFGDRAAPPHAEALKTRSVFSDTSGLWAWPPVPALTCFQSLSRYRHVPPSGPFAVVYPEDIIQQSKAPMYLRGSSVVKSMTQQECLLACP